MPPYNRTMTKEEIQRLIEAGLPDAKVTVRGDDGQHFEAEVTSASFAGKNPVQQHRMVYATLGDKMGREIHALKLTTRAQ
jgi:acid stress-induced BolA-like protein IbaG/YrbA